MKLSTYKHKSRFFFQMASKKEPSRYIGYYFQPLLIFYIGFSRPFFEIESWHYDGHYGKGIVIFGIAIGYQRSYNFDRYPMSDDLREFYQTYAKWLDDGAPDKKPFDRSLGLCYNVEDWASNIKGKNPSETSGIVFELTQQFVRCELSAGYPFGGGDDYELRCMEKTQHLNLERIEWVKHHV